MILIISGAVAQNIRNTLSFTINGVTTQISSLTPIVSFTDSNYAYAVSLNNPSSITVRVNTGSAVSWEAILF